MIRVAKLPAYAFITFLAATLVLLGAWTASAERIKGAVTYFGGPIHGAATHHGDSKPTFVQGAALRLTRRGRVFIVKVNDVCAGSGCKVLDLNPHAFDALGIPRSRGVGRVKIACGRAGHKAMRKCLAGEDK